MEHVGVLLVEDDRSILESMHKYLEGKPNIRVAGTARNGKEAMEMLPMVSADVIVTDLVMPVMDGFELLEYLHQVKYPAAPKVIVLSGLSRDSFIIQAMELGAYFYMCKPVDMSTLYKRIIDHNQFSGQSFVAEAAGGEKPPVSDIGALLDTQGISQAITGHGYLHTAIQLGMGYGELRGRITKDIYPTVAKMHGTTIDKVERAIRHAIQRGWERGDIRNGVFEASHRPSNGEYIAKMIRLLSINEAQSVRATRGEVRRAVN